jgi:hypothetical protein
LAEDTVLAVDGVVVEPGVFMVLLAFWLSFFLRSSSSKISFILFFVPVVTAVVQATVLDVEAEFTGGGGGTWV